MEGRGGVEPPRPLRTTGLQPVLIPYETTYPDGRGAENRTQISGSKTRCPTIERLLLMEVEVGFEPTMWMLQTHAFPLGYSTPKLG